MKDGKWLEPRHRDKSIFEKDYPSVDLAGFDVKCPGCKHIITLNRKSAHGKIACWCKDCNRAVTV